MMALDIRVSAALAPLVEPSTRVCQIAPVRRQQCAAIQTVLQKIATGILPDGATFEKSDFVRDHAKKFLDNFQITG